MSFGYMYDSIVKDYFVFHILTTHNLSDHLVKIVKELRRNSKS